jgi:GNAT superfamily N-acetyltransferase
MTPQPVVKPLVPQVRPWNWDQTYDIDGEEYLGFRMPAPVTECRGLHLLRGLPPRYLDPILVACQTSPTTHAWRVDRQRSAAEVDGEILAKARVLFDRDAVTLRSGFVTGLVELEDGTREVFGVAAVRHQISTTYFSPGWLVIGRLLIRPEYRGQGFARALNVSFFGSSQHLIQPPAVGAFLPAENEQTLHLCQKAVASGALDMIPTGHKYWKLVQQELDMPVYAIFYPGMRRWWQAAVAEAREQVAGIVSGALAELLDAAERAVQVGWDRESGRSLGRLFTECEVELRALTRRYRQLALCHDFLAAAHEMGTLEG